MTFDRAALPEPMAYYQGTGLTLIGPKSSKWKTTSCEFHGGSDSMRIHVSSGGFVCMSCGARGGDIVAHYQAAKGVGFVKAAKALGAWIESGQPQPQPHRRPTPLSPGLAINVLQFEANLVAVAACNLATGVQLTDQDKARLLRAAGRINAIAGAYQ